LAAARGYRPKLIRVALGNVSNDKVLEALINAAESISQALADDGAGVVVLE
jgi:predicted nuclease of predicted toxin-antitoxin system